MKFIEYLQIQAAEIILRVHIIAMHPILPEGHYEIKLDSDWVPVYVSIPGGETAASLVHMDISSSDKRILVLLRVYRRVAHEIFYELRNHSGEYFLVEYESVQKLGWIYVTGIFLTDRGHKTWYERFPFNCILTDGTKVRGYASEIVREGKRGLMLYPKDDSSIQDSYRIVEKQEEEELLLEECRMDENNADLVYELESGEDFNFEDYIQRMEE